MQAFTIANIQNDGMKMWHRAFHSSIFYRAYLVQRRGEMTLILERKTTPRLIITVRTQYALSHHCRVGAELPLPAVISVKNTVRPDVLQVIIVRNSSVRPRYVSHDLPCGVSVMTSEQCKGHLRKGSGISFLVSISHDLVVSTFSNTDLMFGVWIFVLAFSVGIGIFS